METYSEYLAHHGILGMKWGKRNGPPYPLNEEDHSASEKKAGYKNSLNGGSDSKKQSKRELRKAEKEEVKRKKQLEKEAVERERKSNNPVFVAKELKERANREEYRSRIDDLHKQADRLVEESQTISDNILSDFKSYKVTDADKKWLLDEIKKDFGSLDEFYNDDEFVEFYGMDYARYLLGKNIISKQKNGYHEFYAEQDKYWDDLSKLTEDIAGDLSDKKANSDLYLGVVRTGREAVSDILSNKVNSSFMSYMYKHFDDYWVYDTDEYYEAENKIMSEMEKMRKRQ